MKKFKKLFFSLIIMFVCIFGIKYNVYAEEQEENYRIDVIAKTGSAGSDLTMSLEGFDKAEAIENGYSYYIKFVKNENEKPVLSETLDELSEDSDEIFGSYHMVNLAYNETKDIYNSSIYIEDDWYMVDGYTKAYIVKCDRNSETLKLECEVLENPVTVEKPALPSLSQRYKYYLFGDEGELSVFPYFPCLGKNGSHELNVKIGHIDDVQLLKKISKNEAGSYEALISYAKTNDGTVYTFNDKNYYNIDTSGFEVINGDYYYIYAYYTNTDGVYRNLDDVTVVMGDHNTLVNDVVWNFDESLWDKFVEKFKDTDLVKLYEEAEVATLDITYTSDSLKVELNDGEKTWTTDFKYNDGILSYVPATDDDVAFNDAFWISNALYALCELKEYNITRVSKWIDLKDSFSIDVDGIEFETEEYKYNEESDGVSTFIESEIFKKFKLDIQNGLKTYDESKIAYYEFIKGENQKYKVGESKELKFEIDGEFQLFDSVYVDGKKVEKDNYTAVDGSTVITLKKAYLDTLSNGVHTLRVNYKDGEFAETKFTIEKTEKNPATGINIQYGIFAMLILIGLSTYLIIRKKTRFPKHN